MGLEQKTFFETRTISEIKYLDPIIKINDLAEEIIKLEEDEAIAIPSFVFSKSTDKSSVKNRYPNLFPVNQPKTFSEVINQEYKILEGYLQGIQENFQDENDIFFEGLSFLGVSPKDQRKRIITFQSIDQAIRLFINAEHYFERWNRFGIGLEMRQKNISFGNFPKSSFVNSEVLVPSDDKGVGRYKYLLKNIPFHDDPVSRAVILNFDVEGIKSNQRDLQRQNKSNNDIRLESHMLAGYLKTINELAKTYEQKGALRSKMFPIFSYDFIKQVDKIRNNVLIKDMNSGKLVKPRQFEYSILIARLISKYKKEHIRTNNDPKLADYYPNNYK